MRSGTPSIFRALLCAFQFFIIPFIILHSANAALIFHERTGNKSLLPFFKAKTYKRVGNFCHPVFIFHEFQIAWNIIYLPWPWFSQDWFLVLTSSFAHRWGTLELHLMRTCWSPWVHTDGLIQSLYWDVSIHVCADESRILQWLCLEDPVSNWQRPSHLPICIPQGQAVQRYLCSFQQRPPEPQRRRCVDFFPQK